MFSIEQIRKIDNKYFNIINAGCYTITIQSRNTKHFWHIIARENGKITSCEVLHKHNEYDVYHRHSTKGSLETVLCDIRDHDLFQLNGRRKPTH